MGRLRSWEKLPEYLKTKEVREYYLALEKKQAGLFLKRGFDVGMSLLLLILLLPVFAVLAVWIKADSKGPVFFRQIRITQYGRRFHIIKFRTMVQDAAQKGSQVTIGGDARITKAGTTLRRYRLDELPQLINILLGDMSFVGTRPEVEKYVRGYTKEMMATLLLPAGITSEASIAYKDEDQLLAGVSDVDKTYLEEVLPQKMKYNLSYLKRFSCLLDLKICINTITGVFRINGGQKG